MSKIGKKPVAIPEGVTVRVMPTGIEVKGKLGTLLVPILPFVEVATADGAVTVSSKALDAQSRANWGTMRALIANAIVGVSVGYTKVLEIEGIGFKAALEGKVLTLTVGFTHPVRFESLAGVALSVEKNTIKVSGMSKEFVGEVAAQIRSIKKPEPYKGTGIHYKGEFIRRKEGKKVAGSGTGA